MYIVSKKSPISPTNIKSCQRIYLMIKTRESNAIMHLFIAWPKAKPSYTGTTCVTPSPESNTTPEVRPEA